MSLPRDFATDLRSVLDHRVLVRLWSSLGPATVEIDHVMFVILVPRTTGSHWGVVATASLPKDWCTAIMRDQVDITMVTVVGERELHSFFQQFTLQLINNPHGNMCFLGKTGTVPPCMVRRDGGQDTVLSLEELITIVRALSLIRWQADTILGWDPLGILLHRVGSLVRQERQRLAPRPR